MHLHLKCARFVLNIAKDSLTSLTLTKCQRFHCRLSKIATICFNISYFFLFKHALCKIGILLSKIRLIHARSTADHRNCARFTSCHVKSVKISARSTADHRNCARFTSRHVKSVKISVRSTADHRNCARFTSRHVKSVKISVRSTADHHNCARFG